jgi:hypothetical protein
MSRDLYCRGIALTLIVGMIALGADARRKSDSTFPGAVNFGSQVIYLNDGCIAVAGTLTSGGFFADLKRIDSATESEFRKNGSIVTKYPETLSASIRMVGGECDAALSRPPASVFRGDSYSLTFQLEWKDGMQLRPAALTPVVAHCTGTSSIPIPSRDFTIPSVTCQMTVDSRGVPLSDHLIVSVINADGKLLTRLSAHP